jgi:hypothetical protein
MDWGWGVVSIMLQLCLTPGIVGQEAGWAPGPVWTQVLEEKSFLCPCQGLNPGHPVHRHYTDWATLAHIQMITSHCLFLILIFLSNYVDQWWWNICRVLVCVKNFRWFVSALIAVVSSSPVFFQCLLNFVLSKLSVWIKLVLDKFAMSDLNFHCMLTMPHVPHCHHLWSKVHESFSACVPVFKKKLKNLGC